MRTLPVEKISARYEVRPLTEADVPAMLELARGNPTYYEHMHARPAAEKLRADLTALPPGKTMEDKYFLGFLRDGRLAAVLDLIVRYPNPETAFIGWFILDKSLQGAGRGTTLLEEILVFLGREGFRSARLGYVKGNRESERFWLKNQFTPTGIETDGGGYTIVVMQRELS